MGAGGGASQPFWAVRQQYAFLPAGQPLAQFENPALQSYGQDVVAMMGAGGGTTGIGGGAIGIGGGGGGLNTGIGGGGVGGHPMWWCIQHHAFFCCVHVFGAPTAQFGSAGGAGGAGAGGGGAGGGAGGGRGGGM